ncbi:uncharacterized protein ACNLHF_012242 [Anomaloglossus baeobatrachus]
MERLVIKQYKTMAKTTLLQPIRKLRERVKWQPNKFRLFFRTREEKSKPTRRSRRRRRLGNDTSVTETLKDVSLTHFFSSHIVHFFIDEDFLYDTHTYQTPCEQYTDGSTPQHIITKTIRMFPSPTTIRCNLSGNISHTTTSISKDVCPHLNSPYVMNMQNRA